MVHIKDINYVAYLSTVKGIDFDTYKKYNLDDGHRIITTFIYENLTSDDYQRAIADFQKSDISMFVNKLRNLKTIVHDNENGSVYYGKEDFGDDV